jgi:hypothetical protein
MATIFFPYSALSPVGISAEFFFAYPPIKGSQTRIDDQSGLAARALNQLTNFS